MKSRIWPAAVAFAVVCLPLRADTVEGVLELRWGDSAPGAPIMSHFEAAIVADDGRRVLLDTPSALLAAGNLFQLGGQRVVVDTTAQRASAEAGNAWLVGSIAPVQQISGVATPLAVTDAQPWVTLLCKFPDVAVEPQPLSYFSMMLSNATGRLDDYWREVSCNKINIVGSQAYGWFTLPHPRSYYVPADANCSSSRANLDALFADCTGVADATVNFSPFVGINTMYNEELDGCAWGGGEYATLDGVHQLWYTTWEPPWGYTHEAPLAHEMGHGFGLPHANNSDGDGDTYDNPWDVMSDSWDNATGSAVGTYGWLPKHLNVWSRDKLGWIDAARKLTISTNGLYSDIVLDRASLIGSTNRQMIVVTLPSPQPATHYYTIEARKRVGTYEASLAGDAVIIHEVDTATRVSPSWSVDAAVPPADVSNNEGSMFKVGESWVAPGGAFTVTVKSATTDGFVIDVLRGSDRIFTNGFDP